MANLKKLEPVAFVLLFIALYYALVVLAPHSALYDFPTAKHWRAWPRSSLPLLW